jgi:hypothetical protein
MPSLIFILILCMKLALYGQLLNLKFNVALCCVCKRALQYAQLFIGQRHGDVFVHKLWLSVLDCMSHVTYGTLRSASGKEELEEFTVHHTGAGAFTFTAALPFSWLLYDLLHDTIAQSRSDHSKGCH